MSGSQTNVSLSSLLSINTDKLSIQKSALETQLLDIDTNASFRNVMADHKESNPSRSEHPSKKADDAKPSESRSKEEPSDQQVKNADKAESKHEMHNSSGDNHDQQSHSDAQRADKSEAEAEEGSNHSESTDDAENAAVEQESQTIAGETEEQGQTSESALSIETSLPGEALANGGVTGSPEFETVTLAEDGVSNNVLGSEAIAVVETLADGKAVASAGITGAAAIAGGTGLSPQATGLKQQPSAGEGARDAGATLASSVLNAHRSASAQNGKGVPADALSEEQGEVLEVLKTPARDTELPIMRSDKSAAARSDSLVFGQLAGQMLNKANSPQSAAAESDSGVDSLSLKQSLSPVQLSLAAARVSQPALTQYQVADPRSGLLQTNVTTLVGQPQWGRAVAERVLWMAAQNVNSAEIHLDPPELGPMQVRISINQEQASVSFVSQHATVREALDQNAFRLREQFEEQGLNLVNVDVSDQSMAQQSETDSGDQQGGAPGTEGHSEDEENSVASLTRIPLGLIDQYA